MNRRLFVAAGLVAAAAVLPVLGYQDSKTSAPPVAPPAFAESEDVLAVLDKKVRFEEIPANVPLREILDNLCKQFDLKIVLKEEAYKAEGFEGILDRKPNVNQKLHGFRLSQFLKIVLEGCNSGYLVRKDYIEIDPITTYREQYVPQEVLTDDGPFVRTSLPLISAKFQEMNFEEAVRQLADANAMTVVLSAKVPAEARVTKITERLLNVPFDTAVELLAAKADLVVVRKDLAFTVVTRTERPEKPKVTPMVPASRGGAGMEDNPR